MRILISFLVTAVLAISGTFAANDWSVPCTEGVCQYDLVNNGERSGTLKIWGHKKALSDITIAAGWRILGCINGVREQSIRIICESPSGMCSHLFSHKGAVNKIVRLPEECGGSPFARVRRAWIHEDQELPDELTKGLWKRDGQFPPVYGLVFDTDFHKIDHTEMGPIRFAIRALTVPDAKTEIDTHLPLAKRSGRLVERSHEDIVKHSLRSLVDSIKGYREHAQEAIVNFQGDSMEEGKGVLGDMMGKAHHVKDYINATEHEAQHHVKDVYHSTGHKSKEWLHDSDSFNVNKTIKFGSQHVDRNVTLFRQSLNCPPFYPGFEINVNPTGSFSGTFGLVASGTIVPPYIHDFSAVAHFSCDIHAMFEFHGGVIIETGTGRKPIFNLPLPHLGVPGIVDMKPRFEIGLQADASLDLAIGARIPFAYTVNNAMIVYPPKEGHESILKDLGISSGPYELKVSPYARSMAGFLGHVIPVIYLDGTVFGQPNNINVIVDALILLRFYLEATGKYRTVNVSKHLFDKYIREGMFDAKSLNHTALRHALGLEDGSSGGKPFKGPEVQKRAYKTSTTPLLYRRDATPEAAEPGPGPAPWPGYYGTPPNIDPGKLNDTAHVGCFAAYFYVDISVGYDKNGDKPISILKFFDKSTRYSFFRTWKTLYMKCLGTNQPVPEFLKAKMAKHHSKRSLSVRSLPSRALTPRPVSSLVRRAKFLGAKCLGTSISAAQMVPLGNGSYTGINLSHTFNFS